jgi:hypothetical protein
MSSKHMTKLWWHELEVGSLPSQRMFRQLRSRYDRNRWMPEILALGEFALRIEGCRLELEHLIRHYDASPSEQYLVEIVLHHTPFRRRVTLGVLDILERLAVEHVPDASLRPPCSMDMEELKQLRCFPRQHRLEIWDPLFRFLWLREEKKREVMNGWSPDAIRAELLLPENSRLCLAGGNHILYESIEDFYREDLPLSLQFEQLEEYYALYRSYPGCRGRDRDEYGRSEFERMVGADIVALASFVRHLDWMQRRLDAP